MNTLLEPSAQYKFARNPIEEIRKAVLRTVEERSDNPRVVWNAMLVSTRLQSSSDATFTSEQFSMHLNVLEQGSNSPKLMWNLFWVLPQSPSPSSPPLLHHRIE